MKKKTSLKKVNTLHDELITFQQVKMDFIIYSIAHQYNLMFEFFQSPKGKQIAKNEDGKDNAAIGTAPTSATSNTENVHKSKDGLVRKMQFYLYLVESIILCSAINLG